MPSISVSHTTDKSREDLWNVLTDFPNIADWASGVKVSTQTGAHPNGVGATRHCVVGGNGTLDETIQQVEDQRQMVISIDKTTKLPVRSAVSTFTIEDSPQGRKISMDSEVELKGIGKLMGPILKKGLAEGNGKLLEEWAAAA